MKRLTTEKKSLLQFINIKHNYCNKLKRALVMSAQKIKRWNIKMMVYHGSKEFFNEFDYSKIGLNGTSEGKGFYFTDNKNIALGYGEEGYLYTVKFHGKKSLHSDKKTITQQQLKRYLKALDDETEYLSNWGDKHYQGLESVLNEAVSGEFESSENDVDLISGIANGCGDMETSLMLLHKILGYDSIVEVAEWGKQCLYIALINEIIEVIDVTKNN